MPLDPATLCARTTKGDSELVAPAHGLVIAQRRLLAMLDQPLGYDELARRPGIVIDRLERDLTRLVRDGLVEVHRPAATAAPTTTRGPLPSAIPKRPVAARFSTRPSDRHPPIPPVTAATGHKVRRGRALAAGFFTLAVVGAGIGYLASPPDSNESRRDARVSASPPVLKPVTRVMPPFPREALLAGVSQGSVRARLTLDAAGRVTGVDILASQPDRVFDRTASNTLSRWTFEPGAPGRTTEVDVAFKRN